ncbi:MAG: Maf family nucleotide pyrophosphatase [Rikenellaceae bacterium]
MLLHEIIEREGYDIILASQSPRRRDLMRDCGIPFRTASFDVEEVYPSETSAAEVAEYLSKLKSEGYPDVLGEREILITADTVVLLGDQILGKPKGEDGARKMLSELSGSEHQVVTGVTIRSHSKSLSFSTVTSVKFATLSPEQIEYYVTRYSPLDKAGSYGIQEWIGYVGIEGIEGSFYNVMGLPIQRLYSELTTFLENNLGK